MSTAVEPRLPVVGRYRFADDSTRTLMRRQISWPLWQGGVFGALTFLGLATIQPAMAVAVSLAVTVLACYPRQFSKAGPVALALVAGVWLAGTISASTAISGLQVLTAGALLGAGLSWLEKAPLDRWRLIQTSLAGMATAGLGWWAATRLLGGLPVEPLYAALHGALFGLLACQGMVIAALRYRTAQRIPSPHRIKATLRPDYQPPCLKAWRLDRELAAQAPDPETRDGLGEVAAWIYKLQWSLQMMDREIDEISDMDLHSRIARIYEEAEQCDDDFTRERRLAAAGHLQQLAGHRDALILERQRMAALVEYAAAYQEEARAGLVLARLQPGDYVPARLDDVLTRLRNHSQKQIAERKTVREMALIGTSG
ncbi:MAG: hypothetical protein AAFV53_31685 [Myxococcota bacterium]